MRVNDVSHISRRLVFLRIYEVLIEANQSILDLRDKDTEIHGVNYDAGYPFCYFNGEMLEDLLAQLIFWRDQHLTLGDAVTQNQPDFTHWLTSDIRQVSINEFFSWQPHTARVQELVDDVKQRVLDVVDAIHCAERLKATHGGGLLHVMVDGGKGLMTGPVRHSLSYRLENNHFVPLMYDAAYEVSPKWQMHALIHGLWLVGQQDGHVRVDAAADRGEHTIIHGPLYLV